MAVREVRAPDGRVWWVKRGYIPRYRTLRESLALDLADKERRWYLAPLRRVAGAPLYREVVPTPARLAVGSAQPSALDPVTQRPTGYVDDLVALPIDAAMRVVSLPFDPGAGIDLGSAAVAHLLDVGGGSTIPGDVAFLTIGGGSTMPGDLAGHAACAAFAGGTGGGGDLSGGGGGDTGGGGGGGDGLGLLLIVALVAAVAVAGLAFLWFVVVPLMLAFADVAALGLLALFAGAARLVLRRPWDVMAVEDLEDLEGGARRIRRWEVRGFRRAGRVRDDVARALATATDPDLAVVRVLVREPRDDDAAGSARSVTEIESHESHPAEAVLAPLPAPASAPRVERAEGSGPPPVAAVATAPSLDVPVDDPFDDRRIRDLAHLVHLVDTSAGALTGRPDGCFSPDQLRTALHRIDDRAQAVAATDLDARQQEGLARLRDGIRRRLAASQGSPSTGPTFWRLDPHDGRIASP